MPVIKRNATGALKKKVDLSTVPSDALRTLAGEATPQKNYASDQAIANSTQYAAPTPNIASDAAIAASQRFSAPFPTEPGKTYASDEALANSVRYDSPVPDADEIKGRSNYTTLAGISQPARRTFERSADTDEYYGLMKDAEGNRPGPYQNRYEGAVQSILDGILNRKSFDLSADKNYNNLYNLYAEQYRANADRAMRDNLGAMAGLTGGYGSTAATAAAGQAYDRAMEGLNSQNLALANLAYQMYGDETADRYNRLNAVNGLEQSDYARYRDTVNDFMNDRAYYANQYQNFYGNDWNQYQLDTNLDWQEYSDAADRAYQADRDYKADYNNAFERAYKLASQGMDIPASYTGPLETDTVASLNELAEKVRGQQAAALAGGGSGGSGGSGGGRSSGGGSRRRSSYSGSTSKTKAGYGNLTIDQFANSLKSAIDNGELSHEEATEEIRNFVRDRGIQPSNITTIARRTGVNLAGGKGEINRDDGGTDTLPESITRREYNMAIAQIRKDFPDNAEEMIRRYNDMLEQNAIEVR